MKLSPAGQAAPPEIVRNENAYLSEAPQAEPQAAGFSSGLSPAPQAEPQAAGFSFGLSEAPQAEPQAAGFSFGLSDAPQADVADFSFQPAKFESAILQYLHCEFWNVFRSLIILYDTTGTKKSTHKSIT